MSVPVRQHVEPGDTLAVDALRSAAVVARDLAIRVEVVVARRPGIVEQARALAESLELSSAIEIDANGICIQFTPRPNATMRDASSETRQDAMHGIEHRPR